MLIRNIRKFFFWGRQLDLLFYFRKIYSKYVRENISNYTLKLVIARLKKKKVFHNFLYFMITNSVNKTFEHMKVFLIIELANSQASY